jgi:hypothetical protein
VLVIAAIVAGMFLLSGRMGLHWNSPLSRPSCPNDTVVWLNTDSMVYHLPGDPWYGATDHGKYICQTAADAEGAHVSGWRQ